MLSERDFGSILLTYAGLPDSKKSRMLKRVRRKYKDEPKVRNTETPLQIIQVLLRKIMKSVIGNNIQFSVIPHHSYVAPLIALAFELNGVR